MTSPDPTPHHLFSFGVIADVQYADCENRLDYKQENWRYYREALSRLKDAVHVWNSAPGGHRVDFVLQLGDLIDGVNKRQGQQQVALDRVLQELQNFQGTVHHTWGNHEFYNFTRLELLRGPLNSVPITHDAQPRITSYYAFSPHSKFLFVMLDTFTKAMCGYSETDAEYIESKTFLQSKNRNADLNSPVGLEGVDRRFCMFNGGVDEGQLAWLAETLSAAEKQGQKVIISGHQTLHPDAGDTLCLCWNYSEVLSVLQRHEGTVLAYLCGHDHDGGDVCDKAGIWHLTMPGIVEARPGQNDFATVHVYDDRIVIDGSGRVPCKTIVIK